MTCLQSQYISMLCGDDCVSSHSNRVDALPSSKNAFPVQAGSCSGGTHKIPGSQVYNFFFFYIAVWREGCLPAWREVSLCMSYITTQDTKGTKCDGRVSRPCAQAAAADGDSHSSIRYKCERQLRFFFLITTGTSVDADAQNDFRTFAQRLTTSAQK